MIRNVILVEDEPEVARRISGYLVSRPGSKQGDRYHVVGVAHDLAAARALVGAVSVDLILLDVYLPDGLGLDLLAELRASGRQVEAILVTAAKEVPVLERGMQLGVCDFLVKPLMLSRLDQALTRFETKIHELAGARELTQTVADALMAPAPRRLPSSPEELPKGVDARTLERVRAMYEEAPDRVVTAQGMGDLLGVSRSTARRYLEYLASVGMLRAEQKYGAVGRPERCYRRATD